jgi:hypothetical protein
MIYNNYNNLKSAKNTDPTVVNIRYFLPESYQSFVIIITQSLKVKIGCCLLITKLKNVQDSLKILSNAFGQETLENSKHCPYWLV